MISLAHIYIIGGLFFASMALLSAFDPTNPRRWRNTGFWGLLAASFLLGARLTDFANGLLALGLALLAAFGLGEGKPTTTSQEVRRASAMRRGDILFLPALIIPAAALLGTLAANLVGGYLVGIALGWVMHRPGVAPEWRLFLVTGLLGGLTTFSTFSAEIVQQLVRQQYGAALLGVVLHLFGSLLLTALGLHTYRLLRFGA